MVTGLRLAGAGMVALGVLAAVLLGLAPAWVLAMYVMLGAVSFAVYGFDKRAARRGDWRVTEASMHGIDLIGGIVGGLLAQLVFRHKTRKESFVAVSALISVGHIAALGALLAGVWGVPEVLFLL
jgi:uncharacterized membrane protein YsdA (DUF1294 family)